MARPLPLNDPHRNGANGTHSAQATLESSAPTTAELEEVEQLRTENTQLRSLCQELEQALQEAAQQLRPDLEQQIRDYEAVVEEKNERIRLLHQQMQEIEASAESTKRVAARAASTPPAQQGPLSSEAELLALSEQLERERRQLQEDEQSLMDQMREMEVSMARERAELARQRNDMQRLQSEIRHELERLERDGGIQSKIEGLRSKLQDASARRGAAPLSAKSRSTPIAQAASPSRKEGLMGRLFKRGSD